MTLWQWKVHAISEHQFCLASSLFFSSVRPSIVDISLASHNPAATLKKADSPSNPIAEPLNKRIINIPTAGVAMLATFAIVFATEPSVATSFPPAIDRAIQRFRLSKAEVQANHIIAKSRLIGVDPLNLDS